MRNFARPFVAALIALSLAACGFSHGSGVSTLPQQPDVSSHWVFAAKHPTRKRIKGAIRIAIPKHRHRVRIHGHYVSPATKSITIAITPQGGGTTQNFNADLTPASNSNCTSSLVSPDICTVSISLAPGSYTGTFATYDGLLSGGNAPSNPPTGNELSGNQNVPFTFTAGTANTVAVTLDAIPVSATILPVDAELWGNPATGFTAYTSFMTSTVEVLALDADKNIILGPGAPVPTLTSDNTAAIGVTSPSGSSSTPNTFEVTEPALGTPGLAANLTATVTPIAGSGGTAKSVKSAVTLATAPTIIQNGDFSSTALTPGWTACSFPFTSRTAAVNPQPTPMSVSTQYTASPNPTWAPIPAASLAPLVNVVTPPPNLNPSPVPAIAPTLAPPVSGYVAFTGDQDGETPGAQGVCQQFTVSASQPYLSFAVYEAGNEYAFKYDDQEADILDSTGTTIQQTLFAELSCFDFPGTLGTFTQGTPAPSPSPSPTPFTNTGCEPNHTTYPSFNGTSTFTDWQGGAWIKRGPYDLSAYAGQTVTLFIGIFSDQNEVPGTNNAKYWNGMFIGNVQVSANPGFPTSFPGARRGPVHRVSGT